MTPTAQEKLNRWNNELKPSFLERSSNVRLCRNVSYAFSLIATVGAYVSGSRLRGTPAFTLTVLGITAGTAVVAAAVGRHFGRQTPSRKTLSGSSSNTKSQNRRFLMQLTLS